LGSCSSGSIVAQHSQHRYLSTTASSKWMYVPLPSTRCVSSAMTSTNRLRFPHSGQTSSFWVGEGTGFVLIVHLCYPTFRNTLWIRNVFSARTCWRSRAPDEEGMKARSDTTGERPGRGGEACCPPGLQFLLPRRAWTSPAQGARSLAVSTPVFQWFLASFVVFGPLHLSGLCLCGLRPSIEFLLPRS